MADVLPQLDEGFLAVAGAYSNSAREQGRDNLAGAHGSCAALLLLQHSKQCDLLLTAADLIDELREEVVRQVTRRLPTELQILNLATQIGPRCARMLLPWLPPDDQQQQQLSPTSCREERHNLLQQSMQGGVQGMIPACLPSALWLAATQSITDMEEKDTIPDLCASLLLPLNHSAVGCYAHTPGS